MTTVEIFLALSVIVYTPVDSTYTVGLRPTGPEPIQVCGLETYTRAGDIIGSWADVGAIDQWEDHYLTFTAPPEFLGEPDLLIRGFCTNEKGTTKSLQVGCLDYNPADCVRLCGDINADLKITLLDLVLVRKLVATDESHPFCDVTGDGLCSLLDFIQVRKAVASKDWSLLNQTCSERTTQP